MQETYGIRLPREVGEEDAAYLGALAWQLPRTSRTWRAVDPANAWDDRTRILALAEYELRVLIWQRTEAGAKGRNRPKPLPMPGEQQQITEGDVTKAMAEVDAVLGGEGACPPTDPRSGGPT